MLSYIFRCFILSHMMLASYVYASDYSAGYSKYIRGDFSGAENDFRRAAATSSSTRKARALKMLGITHYMQGERTAAEQSFRQAKALDPNIRIAPSEVLDESVLSFFNGVKAPSAPVAKPAPARPRANKVVQTPERIPTYIRVISNIRTARFSINGQPMGLVNRPTRVKPGMVQVEVTAPGYQRYVGPHRIRPGSENAVRVTLLKIAAPTPTPVPAPRRAIVRPKPKPRVRPKALTQKPVVTKPQRDIRKRRPRRRPSRSNLTAPATLTRKIDVHPLIHFIPMGVNHFIQEKNMEGSIFGATQIAFLTYSFLKNAEGNQVTEDTDNTISERNEVFSRMTDQTERAAYQQETNDFYNQRITYIDGVYQESNIAAGLFVATWGVSAIYSYISHNQDTSKKTTHIWLQPRNDHIALRLKWDF